MTGNTILPSRRQRYIFNLLYGFLSGEKTLHISAFSLLSHLPFFLSSVWAMMVTGNIIIAHPLLLNGLLKGSSLYSFFLIFFFFHRGLQTGPHPPFCESSSSCEAAEQTVQ